MKTHGVYYITGGLRSGKSLICTRKIQEFLLEGRKVVTNFDLKLENMLPSKMRKVQCLRIPDHPTVDDLKAIGQGYDHDDEEHYDESKFGLIVLDELGTWMNSRNWQDKARRPVIDWLLHSGKRRWILMLIIQDLELLDNQAKAATANQYVVRCRRLGDYTVPVIGSAWKLLTGTPLKLPNGHIAVVRNGHEANALVADRWVYRGNDLFRSYNTRQEFDTRDSPSAKMLSSYVSPWHLKGRYEVVKDWAYWRGWLNDRAYMLIFPLFALFLLFIASAGVAGYSVYQQRIISRSLVGLMAQVNAIRSNPALSAASPGAVVPVPASPVLPAVDQCAGFSDEYKAVSIVGYSSRPDGVSYVLKAGEQSFNSSRFVAAGFAVHSVSKCNMRITKGQCSAEIYCSLPSASSESTTAGGAFGTQGGAEKEKKGLISGL